jgi:ABC-2 type transport system permease protein
MYVSFWLAIAIICSVVFKGVATSALAALAVWIFFSFFVSLGADFVASALAPVDKQSATAEAVVRHMKVRNVISLASPISLYTNATSAIIDPTRQTTKALVMMGRLEKLSMERFRGPLPLSQSLLVVFPYLTILVALTLTSFGITYWAFMFQEIRAM